ncbi:MAG: hypothetical protein IIZ13_06660 [Renibacterium sp.]|nr:hypothetical protein [Renibacterium sp.]
MDNVYLSSKFQVHLDWFPANQGGRKNGPPVGGDYTPTVVFVEDLGDLKFSDQESLEKHHSTLLEFSEDSLEGIDATARFLSPDAFREFLKPGSRFYIMEGANAVGVGLIISDEENLNYSS